MSKTFLDKIHHAVGRCNVKHGFLVLGRESIHSGERYSGPKAR